MFRFVSNVFPYRQTYKMLFITTSTKPEKVPIWYRQIEYFWKLCCSRMHRFGSFQASIWFKKSYVLFWGDSTYHFYNEKTNPPIEIKNRLNYASFWTCDSNRSHNIIFFFFLFFFFFFGPTKVTILLVYRTLYYNFITLPDTKWVVKNVL